MNTIYFGHDEREEAGVTVFLQSAMRHAKRPLLLAPLIRSTTRPLPEGSNAFTFRRFLVPWYQGYQGWAVFADGADMLCRADITDLFDHYDERYAVRVVKHQYTTRNPRKYRGSSMEADNLDYERKQWASLMLVNCGHPAWVGVNPTRVREMSPLDLLQMRFLPDASIGELPIEWNWLPDEHGENPDARLIHFTAGVPAFPGHADAPMADEWRAALAAATEATG